MALYGTGSSPVTELLINNVWTDVSSRPRGETKISIKRGRSDEQGRTAAQTCNFALNNRNGDFSNRNPNSPYFGLLPRNTQTRITAGAGDNYLKAVYSDEVSTLNNLSTTDKAVLDIVGDIDIRLDIDPYTWRPGNGSLTSMTLASKGHASGSNLSWVFYLTQAGLLKFRWYPAGTTAGQVSATSTVAVPVTSDRLTVRVTLDVNNGAAGNTVAFYTSDSVTGTFTQLGASVVQAGVTSIFSGAANLVFAGGGDAAQNFFSDSVSFGGKFYRGQVYNGIAGTLRADANPTSQAIGATSWSDGLSTPNTWTVTGSSVRVTTERLRFWGELSSLPQVWDLTGTDFYVPVEAAGMIRRLTQGVDPLSSPMFRNFNQYNPIGYWRLEDGSATSVASSSADTGTAGVVTNVTFGVANDGLPGASSVMQFKDATSKMRLSCQSTTSTSIVSGVFYVKLSALPASAKVLATFYTTGTARKITVAISNAAWTTIFYANDGTTLGTDTTALSTNDPSAGWIGYNLLLDVSAGTLRYSIRWDDVGVGSSGVGPNSLGSGSTGVPTGGLFQASADANYNDAKLSHVFLATTNFDLTSSSFRNASNAWLNETAAARLSRLATEEGEPFEVWGIQNDSEPMGYQLIDTFMNNVYDCTDTDGGVLGECRDALSLMYRTRTSLEDRTDVTWDYSQSVLSDVPLPTEDDQAFTNDVTVTRTNGGSARVTNTDGATSVSPPPTGVGRYATSITRNTATEARLPSLAGWTVLVGSWNDARYPNVAVGMHRSEVLTNATLLAQMIALEIGDTGVLTNLPSTQPPDAVPELIQGYTETFDKFLWTITLNATPAGPYLNAPILGSDFSVIRLDATTHTIGSSLTTTGVSVTLVTPSGSSVWVDSVTYPTEFPFNAKIAGEVVTVTAISGTSSPQTATITRSVNGIVKIHSSGELIRLATPYYIGR